MIEKALKQTGHHQEESACILNMYGEATPGATEYCGLTHTGILPGSLIVVVNLETFLCLLLT